MKKNATTYTFSKEHVIRASGLLSLLMPESSGVGMGVKGLDGRYHLVNGAMEALVGRSAEEITHMTDENLFAPEVAAQLQRSDRQILDGAAASSDELEFSVDGVPMRCLWLKFPVLGQHGKILFIGAVMLDIERRESVSEMRQSLAQLRQTNQELERIMADLESLASTDKLTGTWNRRRMEEALLSEVDRLNRYGQRPSLLVMNVDRFRLVNDEQGQTAGDRVLAKLASVIQGTRRAADAVAHWGADEFVVLCPNTSLDTGALLAKRLRKRIHDEFLAEQKNITVSVGAAECATGEDWEQWYGRAACALDRAKASGRNQIQIAPLAPAADPAL